MRYTMKTNYPIEIQRRNVTPAQFLAYVRRRLKATGGDAFCGCLDLDYFAAGSEPNYDTERDGTHCISRSKPYSMQTYIRQDGRLYNEICEFEFDDEKTGYGYYYLIDAEVETTETAAEPETTREGGKDHTMKTYNLKAYRLVYSDGRGNYSTLAVIAESAEQAAAYYTVEQGVNVITCTETSWPEPEQPRGIVPIGWAAADAETETTETTEAAAEPETTREGGKDHTMKTYEITYSNGNDIYSANLVIAESAEQATAYYTAKGREVIGCTETMSRPKPGQPVVTVPEGWTAPAAEPETETAERAAEIADALDDIRRERAAYGYRTKQRVTARCIREAESVGRPTVRVGYCDLQDALSGITPDYYTAGVYGWNCDVYTIAGLTICTGYRPAAGVRAVGVRELADACRGTDAATRDRLLAEWVVTNREIAREGVRV